MIQVTVDMGFLRRVAAIRAINHVTPALIWMRRGSWAAVGLGIVLALAGQVTLAILLAFVPFIFFPLTWVLPFYAAWISRGQPAVHHQQLRFTTQGVEVIGGAGTGVLRWGAITRFVDSARFLLLFTSSQCACAVPKAALPDAAAVDQLVAFIRQQVASAGPNVPPSLPAPSDTLLTAEFTTSRREVYAAIMAGSKHGPTLWPTYVLMLGLVMWTGILPTWREWRVGGASSVSLPLTLLRLFPLILIVSIRPLASLWAASQHMKTNRAAARPQRIDVTDSGIRVSGPLNDGFFDWSSLSKVAETDRFFLFFLTKAQPAFLPKRVLDADSIKALRQVAERHVDRARLALPTR